MIKRFFLYLKKQKPVPMKVLFRLLLFLIIPALIIGCNKDEEDTPNEDKDTNVFSVQKDKELGREFSNQIESDTSDYDVLDSADHPDAYAHLYRIRDNILEKATINYKDEFRWQVRIIDNDSTLNAFCTPGGYIYFYTGLIRYLENEADFAGVMGHEMAHAARRHSTDQLTKKYGIQILLTLALGENPGKLAEIATGLATLKFSREDEKEADDFGVQYLNPTEYDARGVAGFFEKLEEQGQGGNVPQFLSTHPSPDNRVENINEKWQELGSKEGENFPDRYQEFKDALP